jgi:hypothetical protein
LGEALVSKQKFESPDGNALQIDIDYFGKKRNKTNPTPGPFENPEEGKIELFLK